MSVASPIIIKEPAILEMRDRAFKVGLDKYNNLIASFYEGKDQMSWSMVDSFTIETFIAELQGVVAKKKKGDA